MFHSGEFEIFKKPGFHAVFYGDTLVGSRMPNLTYMLSFADKAEMDAKWDVFRNDPEWKKLSSESAVQFGPAGDEYYEFDFESAGVFAGIGRQGRFRFVSSGTKAQFKFEAFRHSRALTFVQSPDAFCGGLCEVRRNPHYNRRMPIPGYSRRRPVALLGGLVVLFLALAGRAEGVQYVEYTIS